MADPRAFAPILSDQCGALLQVIVIIESQFFVSSLRSSNGVGVLEVFERIEALNGERLRADARYLFIDVVLKPWIRE